MEDKEIRPTYRSRRVVSTLMYGGQMLGPLKEIRKCCRNETFCGQCTGHNMR